MFKEFLISSRSIKTLRGFLDCPRGQGFPHELFVHFREDGSLASQHSLLVSDPDD